MRDRADYMRAYRIRRAAAGNRVPSGTTTRPPAMSVRRISVCDPDDYSHPSSDVRGGP